MIDVSYLRTTVELLDLVRQQLRRAGKPDSDYQVHKHLGVSHQAVSGWRTGRRTMDDDTGLVVAELLEIPPEYVIACLYMERAKSDATRAFWRRLALATTRARVLAALAFLPFVPGLLQLPCQCAITVYYVKRVGPSDFAFLVPSCPASSRRHTPPGILAARRLFPSACRLFQSVPPMDCR